MTGRGDPSDILDAARRGDENAFAALVRPYRRELHGLCYRMLGSVDDADDTVQEVLVRAWRGLAAFQGRSSVRTWLFRIATNACLSRLAGRPARTVPLELGPPAGIGEGPGEMLDRSIWLAPYPDRLLVDDEAGRPEAVAERMESVELAFLAALHRLSPKARAVLILRAVLAFSAQETADALGLSVAAVNSSLQRARAAVKLQVPTRTQQETTRELGEGRVRELVSRYARALAERDVPALLELLHDDATWCMPPMPAWYQGKEAIACFLRHVAFRSRWRHLPTRANGQPAVGCYMWVELEGAYVAAALDVLTLAGDRIAAVTAFVDPRAVAVCGLPERLPRDT
ncbi:MAG TPA: sigma-70 family RNA polymerase sigma factor [Acidimicrobiales bacterium]|nr:sigma-70 family RNA polymerase sigma factor [Acidimicrobiales bacterium]